MLDDPRAPAFMLPGDYLTLDGVLYVARHVDGRNEWQRATEGDKQAMRLIGSMLSPKEPTNG